MNSSDGRLVFRVPPSNRDVWLVQRPLQGAEWTEFWRERLSDGRAVCLVLGAGFDPRADFVLTKLAPLVSGKLRVVILSYGREGATDARTVSKLRTAAMGFGADVDVVQIATEDPSDAHWIGDRSSAQVGLDLAGAPEEEMVVDVSALPRGLFFPLVRQLLQNRTGELHVAVAEQPSIDVAQINPGDETADYLFSFAQEARTGIEDTWTVWVPVLGERHGPAMERLYSLIAPTEICPVLPFPAQNPRRGDDLIVEYNPLLEAWGWDQENVIYASETNPFDLYRQVRSLIDHYRHDLGGVVGGARVVMSALSSKLLSVGVLITAYSESVPVAHIHGQRHEIVQNSTQPEIYDLWLSGEAYEG